MRIKVTGDTHRMFGGILYDCRQSSLTGEDIVIILGDAGINLHGKEADDQLKRQLRQLPVTLFCIHGNHEMRPESIAAYQQKQWHGGAVYVEEAFPQLVFAKDGEVYDLGGRKTLVIGGAYSVDKVDRLVKGMPWFADEQPSDAIKARVEQKLNELNWQVDTVLSHTIPEKYMDAVMQAKKQRRDYPWFIDQSQIDRTTEAWLDTIEDRLQYTQWLAGHHHIDMTVGKLRILYEDIALFAEG